MTEKNRLPNKNINYLILNVIVTNIIFLFNNFDKHIYTSDLDLSVCFNYNATIY